MAALCLLVAVSAVYWHAVSAWVPLHSAFKYRGVGRVRHLSIGSFSTSCSEPTLVSRLPPIERDLLVKQARDELPDHIIESAENYGLIFDRVADDILVRVWMYPKLPREDLESWKSIRRGRDIFFKGRGSFETMKIYEDLSKFQNQFTSGFLPSLSSDILEEVCKDLGDGEDLVVLDSKSMLDYISKQNLLDVWTSIVSNENICKVICKGTRRYHDIQLKASAGALGVFHLNTLRVEAYFSHNEYAKYITAQPKECDIRQHFETYMELWAEPRNMASLDELKNVIICRMIGRPCSWPDEWESMEPKQLLERMREMEIERQIPDQVEYEHLNDLPDQGRLRVLRSSTDVYKAGIELKNCAGNYARHVEADTTILVALESKNKPEKLMALGMICYDKFGMNDEWSQIYLSCNGTPNETTNRKFHEFEPVLRKWHRDRYSLEQVIE